MQMVKTSLQAKFPSWSSPLPQSRGQSANGFSRYANEIRGDFNPYASVDVKDIKTEKVLIKSVDHQGNVTEEIKEVAVCPECGSTNCPCLARVTLQSRLDEENAKGVRNAEKPNPMSVVPQSFNQMSLNIGRNGPTSAYFR